MRPHIKPVIYLHVYPSGFRCWRVRASRPGPWKRPFRGLEGTNWGKAYLRASDLNARSVCL